MTIRPNLPSIEELYIDAAVRHLTAARNHLQCAVLRFDRPWRPAPTPESSHIAEAAKEYRRMRRSCY